MTPDERQLISGLFDRMRAFGATEKDPQAEALIRESVQQIPDASYMLVQSVLVQEHALQQADQRIRELEARVHDLETEAAQAPAQGGGFLGGLFGGGARPAAGQAQRVSGGSVPSAGGRPSSGPGRSGPIGAPARGPFGQQPQAGQGGGFLQSAMATAAGVAGGMLLANSISSMLGGGSAEAAKGGEASSQQQQPEQSQAQETADAGANEDANLQEANYESDDAGDWGGGDWGDSFDI